MNPLTIFFQPKKLQLIRRFSSRIRLAEWRADNSLVASAKKFLNDPDFATLLDTIKNESPANWILTTQVSIEDRAIIQARIEGYTLAVANLESMGVFENPVEPLEATFEQPDEQEKA